MQAPTIAPGDEGTMVSKMRVSPVVKCRYVFIIIILDMEPSSVELEDIGVPVEAP